MYFRLIYIIYKIVLIFIKYSEFIYISLYRTNNFHLIGHGGKFCYSVNIENIQNGAKKHYG